MDPFTKKIFLQDCNLRTMDELIKVVQNEDISLEELKVAELFQNKFDQIEEYFKNQHINKGKTKEKEVFLNSISQKKVTADEIRSKINNKSITFEDIENGTSLSTKTLQALKNYCNLKRTTSFKKVEDLPKMEEGRTDVYFIGVPGSGKSTMLSGILHSAHRNGILLPDPYNQAGSLFQNQLIDDLNKGILPQATAHGSYNYVALSIMGEDGKQHPFNIIEIPGENYIQIYNNGDVDAFLAYIQNKNKKILIFVIDSDSHGAGYVDSIDQINQSLVYVNILQLFQKSGILVETDAIYLAANKFDTVKNGQYGNDNKPDTEIASAFLQEEFLSLINNCKAIRDGSKNKFKIRILPYSIGEVVYKSILERYEPVYADNLLSNIIADSFVIKGGGLAKFFR